MFNSRRLCYTAYVQISQLQLEEAGGKRLVGKQSLVALDTDHIRGYVFETNKLQEIRGASSILDTLNRKTMLETAKLEEFGGEVVYANGGSGLFLNEGDAEEVGQLAEEAYGQQTVRGAA